MLLQIFILLYYINKCYLLQCMGSHRVTFFMKKIRSKKYDGVYYSELLNGDKSYYITFKDKNNKKVWIKVGKHSEGIRENFCFNKRAEQLSRIRLGEDINIGKKRKNSKTLNDIADAFFAEKAYYNKGVQVEQQRYGKHIRNTIGDNSIDDITLEMLKAIQREKQEAGYATQTNNHILQLIKTIYNEAIKNGITKTNPCDGLQWLKINNDRERFLSKEEIDVLFKHIEDSEVYLFTKLALITGARMQSILAIKKKDIDFKNKMITINDFKNDSAYKGFFNEEIGKLLRAKTDNLGINDTVISYTKVMIQKRLVKILNKLFNEGLDKKDAKNRVVIHTLRHTFASHLAINGTPIYTIQKLMNHKSINMTLRYAKLAPDSGINMVTKLYT